MGTGQKVALTHIKNDDIFYFSEKNCLTPCLGGPKFYKICNFQNRINLPPKYQNKFKQTTEHNYSIIRKIIQ